MPEQRVSNFVAPFDTQNPSDLIAGRRQLYDEKQRLAEQKRYERIQAKNKAVYEIMDNMDFETWQPLADQFQPKVNAYMEEFAQEIQATGADAYQLASSPKYIQKMGELEVENKKINAIGDVYKEQIKNVQQSKIMDQEFFTTYINGLVLEGDLKNLDSRQVAQVAATPRAYDANKIMQGITADIKNQISTEGTGGVFELNGKVYARMKGSKMRFAVDKNGEIAPELIQHVLDSNDNIAERFRYDLAEQRFAEENGRNPNAYDFKDHQKVLEIYNSEIKYDDTKETKDYIYQRTNAMLDAYQQQESRNELVSYGNTPEDKDAAAGKDKKYGDDLEESLKTMVPNVLAPIVGYMQPYKRDLLNLVVDKEKGIVGAAYQGTTPDFSGPSFINLTVQTGSDIVGQAMQISGVTVTDDGNGNKLLRLPLSSEADKKSSMSALLQLLNKSQGAKYALPPTGYVNQLTEYETSMKEKARGQRAKDAFADFEKPAADANKPFADFDNFK